MKQKFISFYSDVAQRTAQLSHARRLKVGAVIVKDRRILSYGYNGTPAGEDNNCEDYVFREEKDIDGNVVTVNTNELVTKPNVIHAEDNAIRKLEDDGVSCKDAVIFITHAPCKNCAEKISDSGIIKVYYSQIYRSSAGLEHLKKSGITCEYLE